MYAWKSCPPKRAPHEPGDIELLERPGSLRAGNNISVTKLLGLLAVERERYTQRQDAPKRMLPNGGVNDHDVAQLGQVGKCRLEICHLRDFVERIVCSHRLHTKLSNFMADALSHRPGYIRSTTSSSQLWQERE